MHRVMMFSGIDGTLGGESLVAKDTSRVGDRPSQEEVARAAYHLYEMRGRQDGHDVGDWLSAECELVRHYR